MSRLFKLKPTSIVVASCFILSNVYADEESIVVVGQQLEDIGVGPDFSYVSETSRSATKTALPIAETPRSISVVTREQMDDRASISISDALQYTPGIQANFYGEDNKQDWFVIRGFKQANNGLYMDGTRLYSSGFYSWQIDPFSLERVEIVRGPASSLYGQTPPGGVINLISKRPQFDGGSGSVSLEGGSYSRKQLKLDSNHEISSNLAARFVGLFSDTETRVNNVEGERVMLAPSLTWLVNDRTSITLLGSYQKDDSDPYLQFLPVEGTLTSNVNGKISDSTAVGDPDWEKFEREQLSLGYEFSYRFNTQFEFAQSTRYSEMDIDLKQVYAIGYAADDPTLGPLLDPLAQRNDILRGATVENGSSDALNIDNRLTYQVTTQNTEQTWLLGLDYQSLNISNRNYARTPLVADGNSALPTPFGFSIADPRFNPYNPSYSSNLVLLDSSSATLSPLTDDNLQRIETKNRQLGIYLQSHIEIAQQSILLAGLRYDDVSNQISNTTTGDNTDVDNQEWTYNIGLGFKADNGLLPYLAYQQSFTPVIQLDENGNQAKPEEVESIEIGTKFQPRNFDGYFSAALYLADKTNLVRTSNFGQLTQIGEVRNKGLELEAVANVTPSLTLLANLGLVDSEIRKDIDASRVGKTPAQIADLTASAWANYKVLGGSFDGLSLGVGARYIGETYADDVEDLKVPSYTLFDSTISYQMDDVKLQLAMKNLFDKEYVATCYGNCFYGDRRNFIANVTYSW